MANLFGNTKGRDDNDPIKRLQGEIEGTEYRKQILVTAVENEIQAERQKINNELYQIGLAVYESSANGQDATDKIEAHISAIESYNKIIAEKEGKILEISRRYGEEIGLLRSQMNMNQAQAPQQHYVPGPQAGGARCPKCSKPYTPGIHLFCDDCGQNLSLPAGESPPAALCGKCGTAYTPGRDVFCKSCGQRL